MKYFPHLSLLWTSSALSKKTGCNSITGGSGVVALACS